MTATYFNRNGEGHSRRGTEARENGARAWSRIPAKLRRGLTSKQAETLRISQEWHHAGKYATQVYVYYIEQVEAFWASLDAAQVTAEQVLEAIPGWAMAEPDSPQFSRVRAMMTATGAAEQVRIELTGEDY